MLGYQGSDSRLMGVSSRIRPPVFGAIWLGHPLANGLHMARLEDDADVSGAVVRERR